MAPTKEEMAAIAKTASRTTAAQAENQTATTDGRKKKKKRRCNWNPSIWFEIENVVMGIAITGSVIDILSMGYWMWVCAMTSDGTIVMDAEMLIQVQMVVMHGFLLISEMCLFFAVMIKSHILCYIWIFFRAIWFYLGFMVWMIGLNVQQMKFRDEWNFASKDGLSVFNQVGITKEFVHTFYIMWTISFGVYLFLVLLYAWATVIVVVFACNLLDDFRRLSHRMQSMNMASVSAEIARRVSMGSSRGVPA